MMKKLLTLCIILLGINNKITAHVSDTIKKMDSSVKANATNIISLAKDIKSLTDTVLTPPLISPCAKCEPGVMGYLIIMLPVALFLILTFYFLRWLKREKFKLSDALSSDVPDTTFTTTTTTTPDPKDPTKLLVVKVEEPNYSRSASRVIAFLTALSAIVIALCMVTFYAYGYITNNGGLQNIDELWKVIAGLGIGVVPYVTKVIKEKSTI